MAQLTGNPGIVNSDTSVVDTTQRHTLGTRAWDKDGNEYVYLQGVVSTVAGDWVVFDESYATTRLIANEVGPVAIAMVDVDATTEYGWYQVYGKNTIARTDTVAADAGVFIDATTGRVDDAGVAGDWVSGAATMTADTVNVATVWISYPFVYNNAYLT